MRIKFIFYVLIVAFNFIFSAFSSAESNRNFIMVSAGLFPGVQTNVRIGKNYLLMGNNSNGLSILPALGASYYKAIYQGGHNVSRYGTQIYPFFDAYLSLRLKVIFLELGGGFAVMDSSTRRRVVKLGIVPLGGLRVLFGGDNFQFGPLMSTADGLFALGLRILF